MTTSPKTMTAHPAYEAVDPKDFPAMMEVDRYGSRSTAFDKIISATHSHFWDPLDTLYIDFNEPFDMENAALMPDSFLPELRTEIADRLDEKQKIYLINQTTLFNLSSILHGEQGALSLSASLCHILRDPGAQEYAANQTREEARHVTGFSRYIHTRWNKPLPVSSALGKLLEELVNTPLVWKKLVGMQIVLEGLAMGAFAGFYHRTNDPLLRKLMQLVMTDEAFHHKFGKIWADRTVPKLSKEERDLVEDWALSVFTTLLASGRQLEDRKDIYAAVNLDWREVQEAISKSLTDKAIRTALSKETSRFRTLIKTLLNAGIITQRTAPQYAAFVNMDDLRAEGDEMIGEAIAEDGIAYLRNLERNTSRASSAAAE